MTENEESDPTKVAYWVAFWSRPFGPRKGGINWRGPNLWTGFTFAAALILSQLIKRPLPWGWTWTDVSPTLSYLFAMLSSRIGHSYERAIDEFTPRTVVEAKRANEQIKAVSNLINAAAAATLSIFAFSEIVRSQTPQWGNIICAGAAAFWVHLTARRLLGHLVDETIPT